MGKFALGFVTGIAALIGGIAVLAVLEDEYDDKSYYSLNP